MRLLEPFSIKSMRLPNRVVLAAMVTRLSGEDGFVNAEIRDRYLRFAKGEPGLIVMEAMAVHGYKSGPLLRLSEDRFIPRLRDLAKEVHDTSPSKIATQIIHFLKIARSGWRQLVADVSKVELKLIVQQYGEAAARTRAAGFDAVELHMAHAYTVSSFLSQRNRRADEYGGSLENRMRLMSEILVEVRKRVGGDFPVGVRFDGEECITDGYGLMESREIALRMARLGVDYISISAGGKFEDAVHKPGTPLYPYTGYSGDRCMPGATYLDGHNLYLPAGIKAYLNANGFATPIVGTGKIRTPDFAERVLAEGGADLIGFARTLLADPDWTKKVREGRSDDIVRCISISCCKALDENFRKVRCYLWPKGSLHAPLSDDRAAPAWTDREPLRVWEQPRGYVRLAWTPARDDEGIYGYEIHRARGDGPFEHVQSVTGAMKTEFNDTKAPAGYRYRYFVRAYDFAGNKSPPSNIASIDLPLPVSVG